MKATDVCQAMIKFASKFAQIVHQQPLKLEQFTDGLPFVHMIIDSDSIDLSLSDFQQRSSKWITKVGNLKKLLTKISAFLELVNEKTDRLKQIDVVEIAKNNSSEHLSAFFEVVVSVLMNSSHKEKYIQLIMTLDEHAQNSFVEIIQNSLDQKTFTNTENSSMDHLEEEVLELRRENQQLKGEASELLRKNKSLQRDLGDLREKLACFEEEYEQSRTADQSISNDGLQSQVQQQKILIDNLKIKLISTVRESQYELSQLRQEVVALRIKAKGMQELQATLEQYKEMYNQNLNDQHRLIELQKDKRRLTRQVDEKDQAVRKLQQKIESMVQKNYSMQQTEIYMKLQLEKREVRFKQLQKQVKTRLKSDPSQILPRIADIDPREDEKDEISYLQQQLNKARIALKQLQKQGIKSRKKIERMGQIEAQKKKMQKIILQVNRSKDSQIELLVVSLYELRNQNIKLFQLLKSSEQALGMKH